ncbi:MAG: nucleotide disphospho-sugar-binding domain-containing protein [Caulobacteraceae bacterium]
MKILVAATPLMGHLNPLLAIGYMLINEGHEVVGLSSSVMRDHIEAIGADFRPFPGAADLDLRNISAVFPEIKNIPPGEEMSRFYMERVFIDPIPAQHAALRRTLQDFPADVIITDSGLFGSFPMLLGPRSERPAIVSCGVSFLLSRRDDGAPHLAGLPPASNQAQLEEYARAFKEHEKEFIAPITDYLDKCLETFQVPSLGMNFFDAMVALPDAYLQLTTPSFEFPRRELPTSVHFVGALPTIPSQIPLPSWANELDGSRRIVLVTQGTLANHNFDQLVVPTLIALKNEPDVLVIVTTGGRPIEVIAGPIPDNVRLATYLPFKWALPKTDVLVTNGGYGSVNLALSVGVPIVGAGLTEDKSDVNARVAWSGAGVDLATNEPTPAALRVAIRDVLDNPTYRARASAISRDFKAIDTRHDVLRILREVSNSK